MALRTAGSPSPKKTTRPGRRAISSNTGWAAGVDPPCRERRQAAITAPASKRLEADWQGTLAPHTRARRLSRLFDVPALMVRARDYAPAVPSHLVDLIGAALPNAQHRRSRLRRPHVADHQSGPGQRSRSIKVPCWRSDNRDLFTLPLARPAHPRQACRTVAGQQATHRGDAHDFKDSRNPSFARRGGACAAQPRCALAQSNYPERGITLIVPYGAGGGTDITARMLAKDLERRARQAGDGGEPRRRRRLGRLGRARAGASPTATRIGYLNVPSMYAGYLDRQYNRKETLDSFTPLMNHVLDYNVWAVKADSPFKTVKDVVEAAKKAPETHHRLGLRRRLRRPPRHPVDAGGERHQARSPCITRPPPRPRPPRSAGISRCSAPISARWPKR